MPELPEVETVKKGLSKYLIGQKILSIDVSWSKSFVAAKSDKDKFLLGSKITKIRRRGKVLLIDLSSKYSLAIHLKMTGQLVYIEKTKKFGGGHPTNSLVKGLPDSSTRVIFRVERGKLYFNDQRKFGWIILLPSVEVDNINLLKTMGPEPLSSDFTHKKFATQLQKRPRSSIKSVLLDQKIIAGVGNIYADEALWGARIHPLTSVYKLSQEQLTLLHKELRFVLKLAINYGGSTDRNYVDAEGKIGSYLSFARVFRKQGQACPRCNNAITKTRVASRGTHFCPVCQKINQK